MDFATSTPANTGTSRSASRRSAAAAAAGLSASASSTPRLSRIHEKGELRQLNDRLANYIQRVQELENERSSMLEQLGEKDDSTRREMVNVRRLYEQELADVRSALDGLAGEKARLQIDHGNLRDDNNKLRARNQKKEADLANALVQWRKLEAALSSKDAEYTKLLSEHQRFKDGFTDLQDQMENVEGDLSDTKNQLSTEILQRVELENHVQTLKEQLELQRNVSEQEVLEVRSRYEGHLLELNTGKQKEFDSKLAETMQNLRQDYEVQLQQYRVELEKTFSSKLANAQQASLEKSEVMSTTKDELESTKIRVESLSCQLQQYQKDKLELEMHTQELERAFHRERETLQQRLCEKEQELQIMRSQMNSRLEDYENLLDVKLALDMEINAYRKMLEVEEQRLQLSPSPPKHSSAPSHGHCSRKVRGKKRKLEGACGNTPGSKMSSRSTSHTPVSVVEVDVDGRYVRLKNNSETEQSLGGWVVRRMYPHSEDVSFQFPPSCVLAGWQTLTIWAAGAEMEAGPGDLVLQGHKSWGPTSDVRVVLLNPNLEEMSERRVWMTSRGDENEAEFEEFVAGGGDIQHFQRQDLSQSANCVVM